MWARFRGPPWTRRAKPVTFAGGWSQMVNSRSRNIEEAKKYVNWLWIENAEIQTDWNLSYGFHVPPRLSIARSAQALQAEVPKVALKSIAEYGHALPPAWSGSMNTALNDAVSNIVKNNSDISCRSQERCAQMRTRIAARIAIPRLKVGAASTCSARFSCHFVSIVEFTSLQLFQHLHHENGQAGSAIQPRYHCRSRARKLDAGTAALPCIRAKRVKVRPATAQRRSRSGCLSRPRFWASRFLR